VPNLFLAGDYVRTGIDLPPWRARMNPPGTR